jgi:hypothetical protein
MATLNLQTFIDIRINNRNWLRSKLHKKMRQLNIRDPGQLPNIDEYQEDPLSIVNLK